MFNKIVNILASTKLALVLLTMILLSSVVGVLLPPALGKEVVFSSLWFNLLLILLIVNIVFCITKRTNVLRLSQAGTTIFHLGLVLLCIGVAYDQLFYFEGSIRLTEGETLDCAERTSWDRVKTGPFFQISKLNELGPLYFHKLHVAYREEGKYKGETVEIAVGEDVQQGKRHIIYKPRPLKYKGFEFYRDNKDGFSPLLVLRDLKGKVLYGAYAPLQSIPQKDGKYLYRSGTALAPGRFNFPQDPGLPRVFNLKTTYYPDKTKQMAGTVSFQVWKARPDGESSEELYNGKAAFGERVRAGDYTLSMDEVRYWTSINVTHRPGLGLVFGSFWIAFGGLIMNVILKTIKPATKESAVTFPNSEGISS
jgi:hypothetical protein